MNGEPGMSCKTRRQRETGVATKAPAGRPTKAPLRMAGSSQWTSTCTTTPHDWKEDATDTARTRAQFLSSTSPRRGSGRLLNLRVWAFDTVPEHRASSAARGLSSPHSDQSKRTSVWAAVFHFHLLLALWMFGCDPANLLQSKMTCERTVSTFPL